MSAYVVFVHGVANRAGPDYEATEAARTERFRKLVFGPSVTVHNPYWGAYGANPEGGRYKSLPDYDNPADDSIEVLSVAPPPTTGEAPRLVELAREDFPETVDLIYDGALRRAQENDGTLPDEAAAQARAAAAYALDDPAPTWIKVDLTDHQFLEQLEMRTTAYAQSQPAGGVDEVEVLGLGSWLRDGARDVVDKVRNAGGRVALAAGRDKVHGAIATFIGDVFCYLKDGAGRAPIRALMHEELSRAVDSGKPIVLIGHSMGGVILADCLGDPEFCTGVGLKDGKTVKALVTVGSQPGFFQELDLLGMDPTPHLEVAEHWINVFDELDVLSFLAGPMFSGRVRDMMFSSRTGILDAHSAYFARVQFYERLRRRLHEVGVPVTGAA